MTNNRPLWSIKIRLRNGGEEDKFGEDMITAWPPKGNAKSINLNVKKSVLKKFLDAPDDAYWVNMQVNGPTVASGGGQGLTVDDIKSTFSGGASGPALPF